MKLLYIVWLFTVLVLKLNFKKKITTCELPYFAGIIVICVAQIRQLCFYSQDLIQNTLYT